MLSLLEQIVSALSHAHAAGVIHRDLEPSNVVVRTDAHGEIAKVLDFGIAKAIDAPRTESRRWRRPARTTSTAGWKSGRPSVPVVE